MPALSPAGVGVQASCPARLLPSGSPCPGGRRWEEVTRETGHQGLTRIGLLEEGHAAARAGLATGAEDNPRQVRASLAASTEDRDVWWDPPCGGCLEGWRAGQSAWAQTRIVEGGRGQHQLQGNKNTLISQQKELAAQLRPPS